MLPRLVLASGSPRRQQLLASLGIDFAVINPNVNETRYPGEGPYDYVRRLSRLKAETVAGSLKSPRTVLAADTIVLLAADTIGVDERGELLGKPDGAVAARRMLRRLRNRDHLVCTAFTVARIGEAPDIITDSVHTTVHMRDYTDAEIEDYVASGDPLDKAGSYAIQNTQFNPVAYIEGCYNNVIGLPLCAVKRALSQLGWSEIIVPDGCDCPPFVPGSAPFPLRS